METLNIYKYRALKKAYTNAYMRHGLGSTQVEKCGTCLDECWDGLSEHERRVVAYDEGHELVLVDVDINTYKGWPVRVWGRKFSVSLRDMTDWTDWDGAAYILARSLGILRECDSFIDAKGIFWAANPLGESFDKILLRLADIDVLQYRTEPDRQFRWNVDFRTGDKK